MKKVLRRVTMALYIVCMLCAPAVLPVSAGAQSGIELVPSEGVGNPVSRIDCSETPESPICQELPSTKNPIYGPDGILTRVANVFALITGIISVFMVVVAGVKYITSSGDAAKTNSAKNTLMYAAIGLAVASTATIIAQLVLSRL